MQLSSLVASSLLLAGSVLAQDTSQVQAVKVSNKNGDLVFTPNNIKAAVDTYVQFQYYAKNHSVAQSDFAHPCMPIAQTMPGAAGFFSGFMPTTNDAPQRPVFTIKIKDTKPIWFYCSQAKHCQTGMVGAINAADSGDKTFAAYQAAAGKASANVTPNQSGSQPGSLSGQSSSSTTDSSTASATDSSAYASTTDSSAYASTTDGGYGSASATMTASGSANSTAAATSKSAAAATVARSAQGGLLAVLLTAAFVFWAL